MIRAFRSLGHEVREISIVSSETKLENAQRDAEEAQWKTLVRKLPGAYDLVQIAYNLYGFPALVKAIFSWKPDFLYERYSLWNFAGVLAARLFRKPITVEVNSPFALEQERDGDIRWVKLAAWSERVICNMATAVVVVSTPLKRILASAGVNAARIVVMTNGVNRESFRTAAPDEELRKSLGFENKTVIGFVGWFRNWHRVDLLLEAFRQGRLDTHGAALLLVGDGPAMADLREFVERHEMGAHVVFTGPLPHAKVPAHLNLIDIAVQPAANEYCCPMKILEYMGMGKPLVAPRQENISEMLAEETEALFLQPGDAASLAAALTRLVDDAALRKRMGQAALDAIERRGYLWPANARRVTELMRPAPDVRT
jgi:glycosyltransferase involved in cell wall biosynthesis